MSATTKPLVECEPIPMVVGDDFGDWLYAEGHIDPRLFMLGAIIYTAEAAYAEDAVTLFMDGHAVAKPELFLNRVEHAWYRPVEGSDEAMERCEPTDEGATAWTVICP